MLDIGDIFAYYFADCVVLIVRRLFHRDETEQLHEARGDGLPQQLLLAACIVCPWTKITVNL